MYARLHSSVARLWTRASSGDSSRGDVPGWVLITVMTAALVAALLVVARPMLMGMFETAVKSVQGDM